MMSALAAFLYRWAGLIGQWLGHHPRVFLLFVFGVILLAMELGWRILRSRGFQSWCSQVDGWRLRLLEHRCCKSLRRRFPRFWRIAAARFATDSWRGLPLTLTLLGTVVLLTGVGALGDEAMEEESIWQFDQQLALSLHANGSTHQAMFFEMLAHLGDSRSLIVLGVAAGLVLLWSRRWFLLAGWTLALIGTGWLNRLLKEIFKRVRPELVDPWQTARSWSYPSGHAMNSLVAYGMLAYLLIVASALSALDHRGDGRPGAGGRFQPTLPRGAFFQRCVGWLRGGWSLAGDLHSGL